MPHLIGHAHAIPTAPEEVPPMVVGIPACTDVDAMAGTLVYPGIAIIPNYAQDVLQTDPASLQDSLEANYPIRRAGDEITWGEAQWVEGGNAALKYRGNELKRGKMWFQAGDPKTDGFRKYYYTGCQNRVQLAPTRTLNVGPPDAPEETLPKVVGARACTGVDAVGGGLGDV